MSEVTKASSYDHAALCEQLRSYMEQPQPEEKVNLEALVTRVEEIKAKIIAASTQGAISESGSFPEEKLGEVQGYVQELQAELMKVFEIQKAIAMRWAAQKIDDGVLKETAEQAAVVVLGEYQQRWNLLA